MSPKSILEKSDRGDLILKLLQKFISFLQIPDYRNAVIVAKDPGSAKKATSYAERLRLGEHSYQIT